MASGNAVIGFTLTAEGSGFVGAINVSKQALKNLGDESQKTSKKTQASFDGISGAVKNLLGAVSAGAVGHFIASINAADASLIDLEKTTGIAAEQLARYDKAAALAGVSLNQIADYSIKLGQKLINAIEKPTGDAARAMQALGFSATETAKLMENPGAALDTVAKRLASFENGTEKTAVAIALWGKQGKDLIPVLDDIAEHTRDVGAVSREQAERAKYLTDQMALTKIKAQELGREFLSGLSPALASVAGAFEDVAAEQGTMQAFGEGVGGIFKGLATASAVLSATLKNVAVDIAYLKETASIRGKFDASAAGDWDAMFGSGGNRKKELDNALQTRNEMIAESTAAMESLIKKIWEEPKATEAALDASKKARLNYSNAILNQMLSFNDAVIKSLEKEKKEREDAAKALASQQASFIKGIKEENAAIGLSDREKKKLQARNIGLAGSLDDLIDSLFDAKDAFEAEKQAVKEAEEAQKKFNEAVADRKEYLEGIETETKLLALSAAERKVQIALLEAERKAYGLSADELEEYKEKVEAAMRQQIAVEANIKAQEELRNEWIKTGDQIEQALTNALVDSFDDGKSTWDALKDYIKNTAKTLAVRIPIQWLMGSLGGALAGTAGASTGSAVIAQGAGSGGMGGVMQIGQSIMGMFGGGGMNIFTGTGLGATFANSGIGQMLGLSQTVGPTLPGMAPGMQLTNFGMGMGGVLGGAGMGYGIGSLIGSLGIGHGRHGGSLGSIGGAIGTIWGPIGTVIGSLIGGLIGSLIGRKGGDKTGASAMSEGIEGRYYTPNQQDDIARETITDIEESWAQIAQSLGVNGSNIGFGIGWDTDPKGDAQSRVSGGVYVDGQRIYFNQENLGRDSEKFQEGMALEIQRMLLAAAREVTEGDIKAILGDFDIADATLEEVQQAFADAEYWQRAVEPLRGVIEATLGQAFDFAAIDELARGGETLEATMTRLTTVFSATTTAARLVGQSVDDLFGAGLAGTDDREALAARFGGAEAMADAMSYYMQAFRPDEMMLQIFEESGAAIVSMFDNLNLAVPRSREEFDAIVRGLDLTTEAGQELFTSLMGLAPAFNNFIGALDDMSASMSGTIADLRRSVEYGGLSDQERYGKLKDEADTAWQEFQTATDPAEIQRLFDTITANMAETWNILSDDQKDASRAEYLARLDELEAMKDQRIDAAKETYTELDAANDNIAMAGNTLAQAILDVAGQLGADLSGITLQPVAAGLSDEAASVPINVEDISAVLKPVLLDVAETNADALIVLQAKLDEMNIGQAAEISADAAKKDIETSGKNFNKDVQSAGARFLDVIAEGARVIVAAAQTPQQIAVSFSTPQARPSEAN